jgi:hypothetical protein
MSSLKFTNLLGDLGSRPPTLADVGRWEAAITFCAYISRLNYDAKPRKILESYKYLNFSPIIFNTILGYLKTMNLKDVYTDPIPDNSPIYGKFIYDKANDMPLSVTLFDYSKGGSKIFQEKIIVIGFRGTLSLQTVIKDLNMVTTPLSEIFGDLPQVSSGVGKAHAGFMNGIKSTQRDIVECVNELLKIHNVSRIFVTGHSLGGGYANICGLGLANMKRNGAPLPKIHVITFGGPKTFSESGRDIFNTLLAGGYMTFDRIVNSSYGPDPALLRTNVIPAIPHHLYHPGFSLTTREKYSLTKGTRSRHIGNTRSRAGLVRKQSWVTKRLAFNYNPLPYYPEYFNNFFDSDINPDFTSKDYKALINTSANGTVYTAIGESSQQAKMVIMKLLNITGQELAAMNKEAIEDQAQATSEVVAEEGSTPDVIKELKEVSEEESHAANVSGAPVSYQEDAQAPGPVKGGAWRPWAKVSPNDSPKPPKYVNITKGYYPNEIVYTCSAITTPIPPIPLLHMVQCHLGYMGVGWLGVGSAIIRGRGYYRFATMYRINNIWRYTKDTKDYSLNGSPMPAALALPANAGLGGRARKTRKITRKRTNKK